MMTNHSFILILLLVLNIKIGLSAKLPPSLKVCNAKADGFNSCVEEAAEIASQALKKGNHLNRFMNENSFEILKELKPAVQETFAIAFKDIANRIFTKVPLNEIFVDYKVKYDA